MSRSALYFQIILTIACSSCYHYVSGFIVAINNNYRYCDFTTTSSSSFVKQQQQQQQQNGKHSDIQPNRFCSYSTVKEYCIDQETLSSDNVTSDKATTITSSTVPATVAASTWMDHARELYRYKELHGHTCVPKRYKENPTLGNWVNKQRQLFRQLKDNNNNTSSSPLTPKRIQILNKMGFCWNATKIRQNKQQQHRQQQQQQQQNLEEKVWWDRLEELRIYLKQQSIKIFHVPRQSSLGTWLDRQRTLYRNMRSRKNDKDTTNYKNNDDDNNNDIKKYLSKEQVHALEKIDIDWYMTRREYNWECKFRELKHYSATHNGDCCVPITYKDNQQLANWVSTQRKQYTIRQQKIQKQQHFTTSKTKQYTGMTDERIRRLESIGFVWNRWEYEFDKYEYEYKR